MIFGILPMAGKGSRLQPIAFSKELYPVAYRNRHFAISEFSVRALMRADVNEVKLVINPGKLDIAKYYSSYEAPVAMHFYESKSLPESCLFPIHALRDDDICLFGLPDTLFSPPDGFLKVRKVLENGADICLGLFDVEDGSKYDSVLLDSHDNVLGVKVKTSPPLSNWIWGIWGANVKTLKILKKLIDDQVVHSEEKLLGMGMNSLAQRSDINFKALRLGNQYFDIGTMDAILRVQSIIDDFSF